MRLADRWRLALTFVPALLLFAGLDLVAWKSLQRMEDNLSRVTDTAALETALVRLEGAVLDMETSQRGYLLTHDAAYLRPYADGERAVEGLVATVEAGARESGAHVRTLKDAIEVKRRELALTLRLAETDPPRALETVRTGAGRRAMDDIRASIARIVDDERAHMARQRARMDGSLRDNVALALALSALFSLLVVVAAWLARSEARSRHLATRATARAMSQLELRVTERTQAVERARVDTEVALSRLRAILNSTTEAILSVDDLGRIVVANAAASRAFGYPLERLVGLPLELLFPKHLRSTQLDRALHAAASGEAEQPSGRIAEGRGVRADGEEFPLEGRISYLHLDGSRLFTLVLTDLTAPHRAESALRERDAQQQRLLGLLPDAVFVNRDDRITFANPPALRLFARPASQLLGRSPFEFIDPAAHDLVRARIAMVLEHDRKPPLADIEIVRPDGTHRIVQSTATLMRQDGQSQLVVLMRDVTEHRQAQREVQRSHDRLRALVAAQDAWQEEERRRVSREIHDDLQQSLAAIRIDLSMLDAALGRTGVPVPPEARALIGSIDELTESTVISTRRIVEGLRPRILDEGDLGTAMQAEARAFTRRTGIACTVTASVSQERPAPSAEAITCLYRVFQEALNNVRKHSQATRVDVTLDMPDATLAVRPPSADDDRAAQPCQWRLRVHDDGRGLDPGDASKAGSFGLLGMHERVAAVAGRFAVASGPGEGTWVEAVVPCVARQEA